MMSLGEWISEFVPELGVVFFPTRAVVEGFKHLAFN